MREWAAASASEIEQAKGGEFERVAVHVYKKRYEKKSEGLVLHEVPLLVI